MDNQGQMDLKLDLFKGGTTLVGVSVFSADTGQQIGLQLEKFPDSCPICHRSITPIDHGIGFHTGSGAHQRVERLFRCPSADCQRLFIVRYSKSTSQAYFDFSEAVPYEVKVSECSDIISGISPDYCAIYKQAQKAELARLDLIAGPGYRKALEFLIKDYLLKKYPTTEDRANIEKLQLQKCISTYVTSEKIKLTASRATWLGNDETHFVRKWEDKDLKDLKILIELTVRWIEMEVMTDEILVDMPEGKK
jgi:hypothetical protein